MQQHSAGAGFWDDPKEAEAYLKKMAGVKFWTDAYDGIKKMDEDLEVLLEFAKEDEAAQKDVDAQFEALVGKVEDLELRNMLGEEGDNLGAILKINSGAGGTESNDWSAMLMRMYVRWGERNGYKVAVSDLIEGDEAGSRVRAEYTVWCVSLRSMPRASDRLHFRRCSCILWWMIR